MLYEVITLPIWQSKDLINWTPVAHAITKNVGAVWAPELVKHDKKYFIYFPANKTNWVIWANNIEGPWSEPIDLNINGIDPGHVVDENGNRYLYFSHGYYVSLSDDGLSITSKPEKFTMAGNSPKNGWLNAPASKAPNWQSAANIITSPMHRAEPPGLRPATWW